MSQIYDNQQDIICQYCFDAQKLTNTGELLFPCPVCKGGELKGIKLKKANQKWLKNIEDDFDTLIENEYNT
jgi:hypothetical protein